MNALTDAIARADLHRVQQTVKWVVYSLLLINFGYYAWEDWTRASHVLDADATLLEWAAEFATSIDEVGWFLLLFMYELETYVLEDETWTGWVAHTVRGVRMACFVMLAHTVYAYGVAVIELEPTRPVEDATSLCELTDRDVSYVYNLRYTAIDEANCATLSDATTYYQVADDPVVASAEGLALERELAWVDLAEAIIWLLIVASIELVVRLQGKGVTGGTVMSIANWSKIVLYLLLGVIAVYWATLGHWVYTWDEFVWIAGFAAIEMNVNEWRGELLGEKQ